MKQVLTKSGYIGLFDDTKLRGKPTNVALTHSRFVSAWQSFTADRPGRADFGLVNAFLWNTSGVDLQFCVELNSYQARQFIDFLAEGSRSGRFDAALDARIVTQDLAVRFPMLAGIWTVIAVREVPNV